MRLVTLTDKRRYLMNLNDLQKKNPHIHIYEITDPAFRKYGNVVSGYDFSEAYRVMEGKAIPESGNTYTACDPDLMALGIAKELSAGFYGDMPLQMGFCNGRGTKLDALEYHKGTEIDGAVTDLVLLLSSTTEIKNNSISSEKVEAFFVPAGTVVELFGPTLHFAPCRVSDEGFRCVIVLPEGTNEDLPGKVEPKNDEDKLLWMRNKWLIAHKESNAASNGAYVGITGDNIEIFY